MTDKRESSLFDEIQLRGATFRNRLVVSPMCQYSASNGIPNDWHLVHLGRFALGGFGMVIVEATAIEPKGRISHGDLGLWSDNAIAPFRQITGFLKAHGAVPAVQLGHAGRRASSQRPWEGNGPIVAGNTRPGEPPWPVSAPSAVAHGPDWPVPHALSGTDMERIKDNWAAAAQRAVKAGFEMIELHGAHGYLLHTFLSPLSNYREDAYGGDLTNRMRFPLEVIDRVREALPTDIPLGVRISSIDGDPNGLTLDDAVEFARKMKRSGVDLVDCSSGGIGGGATLAAIPRTFGFQIPFAQRIRQEADIRTMAVGMITEPRLASDAVTAGATDFVAIAREALAVPNWPHHAHRELLGYSDYGAWPKQAGWWLERRESALEKAAGLPPIDLQSE